jgi:DNA-binding response OmpR family regulator
MALINAGAKEYDFANSYPCMGSSSTVLIIGDKESICRVIETRLRLRGYQAILITEIDHALDWLRQKPPGMILLDGMISHENGIAALNRLRKASSAPVMMLGKHEDFQERMAALQMGADDYLARPLSLSELEARTRSLLRRGDMARHSDFHPSDLTTRTLYEIGHLRVNTAKRQVLLHGSRVKVTDTEFKILELLLAVQGKPVSRREILGRIWGADADFSGGMRLVDAHVMRLRRKLRAGPQHPHSIVTVRGVGYMFESLHDPGKPAHQSRWRHHVH